MSVIYALGNDPYVIGYYHDPLQIFSVHAVGLLHHFQLI